MKPLLLTVVVIVGQVAAMIGLYYWRHLSGYSDSGLAHSDIVVFYAPFLIAATLCGRIGYSALRAMKGSLPITLSVVWGLFAACIGFSLAMLWSLNTWGS